MIGAAFVRGSSRELAEKLIDGEFIWGAVISAPSRYGSAHQRLIVYPPGISRDQRRWLRAWRGWPLWGGLLWIIVQVSLRDVVESWLALVIATAMCLALGSVPFVVAGDLRRQVRVVNGCSSATFTDAESAAAQRTLRLLSTILRTADAHYRRGELSMVDYEQVWWRVYDALAPRR